ncbi:NinE family protein [Salmonella enterica]|nr:NinE family protein [Salmonella enterica]EAT5050966.1 NinE family protein [Salmonella enterica subsp. enterica]EBH8355248.1 NinE family protein [Salmonella enterica subsp. diarizonae serovar 61:l,[v],[z13]:1,5,[7]]ECE6903307.1 NinE family protein [Salmonella enterica subsp. diarizonae]EHX2324733.1 NinE family protein [Salmonella enterica subsp. enterica serovar Rubislaw]MBQ4987648.1 NinE family protein [Salmonella enterica subsp. diarizonae serovar 61:l,v:1,5,7]MDW0126578.1 NinE family pro
MSRCQRRRRTYGTTATKYQNCKYLPTKRSRNKPKPIPTESQVKTFDYVYGLLQSKWNRMRKTR